LIKAVTYSKNLTLKEKISVLDPNRKKNIEMILKVVKKSNDEIRMDIFECSKMNDEYVDTLINALPKQEEVNLVNKVKEID